MSASRYLATARRDAEQLAQVSVKNHRHARRQPARPAPAARDRRGGAGLADDRRPADAAAVLPDLRRRRRGGGRRAARRGARRRRCAPSALRSGGLWDHRIRPRVGLRARARRRPRPPTTAAGIGPRRRRPVRGARRLHDRRDRHDRGARPGRRAARAAALAESRAHRRSAGRSRSTRRADCCRAGHPLGATGLAQVAEVVWQLRGEAGRAAGARARASAWWRRWAAARPASTATVASWPSWKDGMTSRVLDDDMLTAASRRRPVPVLRRAARATSRCTGATATGRGSSRGGTTTFEALRDPRFSSDRVKPVFDTKLHRRAADAPASRCSTSSSTGWCSTTRPTTPACAASSTGRSRPRRSPRCGRGSRRSSTSMLDDRPRAWTARPHPRLRLPDPGHRHRRDARRAGRRPRPVQVVVRRRSSSLVFGAADAPDRRDAGPDRACSTWPTTSTSWSTSCRRAPARRTWSSDLIGAPRTPTTG